MSTSKPQATQQDKYLRARNIAELDKLDRLENARKKAILRNRQGLSTLLGGKSFSLADVALGASPTASGATGRSIIRRGTRASAAGGGTGAGGMGGGFGGGGGGGTGGATAAK